ncbi:MFS transporter [Mytilinidion resinicola]|uniref:MFS transporter n=1 Tax=Mytilinidion resinicola TaxID=574789 RepID=A0A6A6Y0H3_9PEZI|nr:MFS transporter [Mytilinidion resinicola]KAF2801514.1 MFS transporter [Mytilinidion resinicola]
MAAAKHHGLPLIPHPTDDERDPLRWPRSLKLAALGATAFANFTANFAGAGLSVATPVLQAQFHKTPNQVNGLLTFNFLLLGIGNLFWVPLGVKFGKRASLLISTLMLFAVLIWTAKETAFTGLLAARCLSGFVSAAGESIVPSIVSDIFFLHEHAAMMSGYTILVSSSTAIGPLIASFIVQYSRGGWVDYVWVCAALAGVNTVGIYFLYPESNFNRPEESLHHVSVTSGDDEKVQVVRTETISRHRVSVVPKPWLSIWTSVFTIDPEINILKVAFRPLKMLLRPSVLLATFIYGTSLASQIILIFAFPSLLLAPPYLFSGSEVGLMQIAAIIGFLIGCFSGGYFADIITAVVIRKQKGAVYPEQRLVALIPGCLIAPAGCILIAFACSEKLHWVAIAFGFGMVSFGTIYAPNIAVTYVVECYPRVVAECLVAINVFKNLVAFLFLYTAVDWVASSGWIQVYMIMFMLVSLGMLLAVPFYFFGQTWRGEVEIANVNG